jgi:hypothetical protein
MCRKYGDVLYFTFFRRRDTNSAPPGYEPRFSRIIDVGDSVWSNPARPWQLSFSQVSISFFCLCERAGEFLGIVLEIGGRDCKNKKIEIYIVMIFFDSWCRTIQNKALVEI